MSGTTGSNPQRVGQNTNIKQFNAIKQSGVQWYYKENNIYPQQINNKDANVLIKGNLTVNGCIDGSFCTQVDLNSVLNNGNSAGDNNINMNNNNILQVNNIDLSSITSNKNLTINANASRVEPGNIIINPDNSRGNLELNGLNIQSLSSGVSAGTYLRIKLNGVYYKIALLKDE